MRESLLLALLVVLWCVPSLGQCQRNVTVRSLPQHQFSKEPQHRSPLDLYVALDSSDSMNQTEYMRVKEQITDFLSSLPINEGEMWASVRPYSYIVSSSLVPLSGNLTEINEGISSLPYLGGGTRTDMALLDGISQLITEGRLGVPKAIVIVTDGASRYPTESSKAVQMATKLGISVYAVGFGESVSLPGLYRLAGTDNVFLGDNINQLSPILISSALVNTSSCLPPTTALPQTTLSLKPIITSLPSSAETSMSRSLNTTSHPLSDDTSKSFSMSRETNATSTLLSRETNATSFLLSRETNVTLLYLGRETNVTSLSLNEDIFTTASSRTVGFSESPPPGSDRETGTLSSAESTASPSTPNGSYRNETASYTHPDVRHTVGISRPVVDIATTRISRQQGDTETTGVYRQVETSLLVEGGANTLLVEGEADATSVWSGNHGNQPKESTPIIGESVTPPSESYTIPNVRAFVATTAQVSSISTNGPSKRGSKTLATATKFKTGIYSNDVTMDTINKHTTSRGPSSSTFVNVEIEQDRKGITDANMMEAFTGTDNGLDRGRTREQIKGTSSPYSGESATNFQSNASTELDNGNVTGTRPTENHIHYETWNIKPPARSHLGSDLARTAPGLCGRPQVINTSKGTGYLSHPSSCDQYIQCYARPDDSVIAVMRQCEPGLFWNSRTLTCDLASNVICASDKCSHLSVRHYNMAGNCRAFWKCVNGRSTPACCSPGFAYFPGPGCIRNSKCHDACPVDCKSKRVCSLMPDWEMPRRYRLDLDLLGWITLSCDFGMFDLSACKCSAYSLFDKGCSAYLLMSFKNDNPISRRVQTTGIKRMPGAAVFLGNSTISVPFSRRESHFYLAKRPWVIRLRYMEESPFAGRTILLRSAPCNFGGLLVVYVNNATLTVKIFLQQGEVAVATLFTEGFARGAWKELEIRFTEPALTVTVSSGSLSYVSFIRVPLSCSMSTCGWTFGNSIDIRELLPFQGYMDNEILKVECAIQDTKKLINNLIGQHRI